MRELADEVSDIEGLEKIVGVSIMVENSKDRMEKRLGMEEVSVPILFA